MNNCKLKVGFKQVFSTTAFGYLHDHRMEQVRLLEEEGMSIGEAPHAVRFSSQSHFSSAFNKRYGINSGSRPRGDAKALSPTAVSSSSRYRLTRQRGLMGGLYK